MISRVAESCFWMNRYLERVENVARLLDVNAGLVIDVDLPKSERWRPLLIVLGEEPMFNRLHKKRDAEDGEQVQSYLTWSEATASSIFGSLFWARENARSIRETISLEMWETVNEVWLWINSRAARTAFSRDRQAFYKELRGRCQLYHGVSLGTMNHEEPFDFMRLGTALERASQTARALDVKYHALGPTRPGIETPEAVAVWLAILRSCSGVEPFFKHHGDDLRGATVAGFLLFNRAFPRSVLHNLDRAGNFLHRIRPRGRGGFPDRAGQALDGMVKRLDGLDMETVLQTGIHALLTEIVDTTAVICDAVRLDYFDVSAQVARRAG